MAKSLGKTFEREIAVGLEALSGASGVFYQRLKDGSGKFKGVANPCDYLLYISPYLHGIECKATQTQSLPFKNIRDVQIEGLEKIRCAGGKGWLAINFRRIGGRTGRTFFLPIETAVDYMDSAKRKSFPFEFVEQNGIEVPRKRFDDKYGWDLSVLGVKS